MLTSNAKPCRRVTFSELPALYYCDPDEEPLADSENNPLKVLIDRDMVTSNFRIWGEDFAPVCLQSYTEPTAGRTYIMFHGTSYQAAWEIMANGFRQSQRGMRGRGVYVSRDIQKSRKYPLDCPEHERVVLKLRVRVGRVKKIDRQGHPMQKTWHDHGYDTAWCPPYSGMVRSGQEEDWDPKSITVIDVINPTSEPAPASTWQCGIL